ncbi:DUF1801 domain-containing protein [Roseivirga sp. E12]|uniref:DUF1801 domain-containing protein n=1 Tax=Roseivirga sp. E12 TaxID=2819237 RepID=UPI001ABC480A|nr:DUF1801 domain-containing protein [Roseivirga sp. E12]MBO3697734.1 DUF1801 domain-containing protein [Roseivirga sp. E12]
MTELLRFTGNDIENIDFKEWLDQKPKALQPLATKWFRVIQQCGELVDTIFHDGHPVACVENTPFAYINVYKAHINLGFFYGAELPDEQGLLEGNGKRMRHIKLFPDRQYDDEKIGSLIEIAYADVIERIMKE